ncbi:winged helix-turn-helix domain-containing protein [Bauldia sp.]|uniref:winged helix-turn-helix domain-containing protein n=1 Tax=Bauldia sp. TaxID=2575872 RepID=UPI003BAB34B7
MTFRVGNTAVDPARREVKRDDQLMSVEPKAFDLLLHLVRNRDRVVDKAELIEVLWQGRAISDSALSTVVKSARRAIGDDGKTQAQIKTHHGRGFRFIGDVREIDSGAAPASIATTEPAPSDATVDIDLSLPDRPSIAVLPINAYGEIQDGVVARGLAHDITVGLARTRWLFVTARGSAMRFDGTQTDPVRAGRRLGVRYLLHGSVLQAGPRFRLTIALTDTTAGCEAWAETFERNTDDLFAVLEETGRQVVAAVESEINLRERRRAILQPIESLDAWSAYHRAIHLLFKFRSAHYDEAEQLLTYAAATDPSSARVPAALSFLAWQRAFLGGRIGRDRHVNEALVFAHEGIALDPYDPQGHWALGRAALLTGDLDQALDEITTAVKLNPNFAVGHYSRGYALMLAGRNTDGLGDVDTARRLSPYDPMSFAFIALKAEQLAFIGQFKPAMEWAKRAIRQPNVHFLVFAIAAWVHEVGGDRDAAVRYIAEAQRRRPGFCRDDYFASFPFAGAQRQLLDGAFNRIGL